MATPLYVDPAMADDTGDGTTPATAKKTIAAAYAAVDDAGEVLLLAGTYDETTQGAGWQVTFDGAKSATIKPDTGVSVTLAPAQADRSIYFSQVGATYTHRLEGVTVTATLGAELVDIAAACLGTCEIINCTFPASAEKFLGTSSGATATRTFRIQGCTITSSAANLIDIRSAALVDVVDNTIVHTGTSAVVRIAGTTTRTNIDGNTVTNGAQLTEVVAATTFSHVVCRNNTITTTPTADNTSMRFRENPTVAGTITIEDNVLTVAASAFTLGAVRIGEATDPPTTVYYKARIIGNSFTTLDVNVGYAIYLGLGCENALVAYNELIDWDSGVYLMGPNNVIDSNYMSCTNGIRGLGADAAKVLHNHIISSNNGGSGRCIVFGRLVKATSTATTTYTSTKITDTGATPWGAKQALVAAGQLALVGADLNPTHWARVVSIAGDEVTTDGWKKCDATNTVETPANNTVCSVMIFARKCVLTDNLLDGKLADNTLTFDFDPDDPLLYSDRNVFVAGGTSLSNLGIRFGTAPTTLAELQTRWALISPVHPENDAHSAERDAVASRYNTYVRWWLMPTWSPHGKKGLLLPW